MEDDDYNFDQKDIAAPASDDDDNQSKHSEGFSDIEADREVNGEGEAEADGEEAVKDDSDDEKNEVSDDDDDDEDEEEQPTVAKSISQPAGNLKKKRKVSDVAPKKRRKKEKKLQLFLDEADEQGDSDDEEEVDAYDRERQEQEIVPDKEALAADERVKNRHEANKLFMKESAQDIAEQYRIRHLQEKEFKNNYGIASESGRANIAVAQQSLLPSTKDPKIFKIKCKVGSEMQLVRSIMLKTFTENNKDGGFAKIKSAFCTGSQGFIYVEALNETFAKQIINGLRGMYGNSFAQIPVSEMTSVLSVTVKKKPMAVGQWVRLKRGALKGDLARVVDLFDGGQRAFIQAVPRPDYSTQEDTRDEPKLAKKNSTTTKVRPQQRLFDAQEAKANKHTVGRAYHPCDSANIPFDTWKNEHYRDGFFFREVNVSTYLDDTNVKPSIEELQMFRPRKSKSEENEDDDNDDESGLKGVGANASFIKELAQQIDSIVGEEEGKDSMNPFVPGDLVKVMKGEMRNLIAKVVSVNDATRVARIVPFESSLSTEMDFEMDFLQKHIFPGSHVKVVAGRYQGQTGRVVNVNDLDGLSVAAVLTDGINTEIQCNIGHLQLSTEVTTGQGNLKGYELYDLVALNQSDMAVVVLVGAEKLRIINSMGLVNDVFPQDLQGKRNYFSGPKASSYDGQQNTVKVGDTVKVITGPHEKLSGTIKHMMKGMLWLHSNSYLKNSGIFVAKSRNCVVAGGKTVAPTLSKSYGGVLQQGPVPSQGVGGSSTGDFGRSPSSAGSGRQGNQGRGAGGGGRDAAVGKTVKIKKGKYQGLMAQVITATPTHYRVELLARFKQATIARSEAETVGDKQGPINTADKIAAPVYSLDQTMAVPPTPFLTSATPSHYGSETPRFVTGGETPMAGYGDRTPRSYGERDNVWQINSFDEEEAPEFNSSSSYGNFNNAGDSSNTSWAYSRPNTEPSLFDGAPSPASSSNYTLSSFTAGGSKHSGNNSVYSTADSPFGSHPPTPSHVAAIPAAPAVPAATVTYRDWMENFVLLISKGVGTGRLAVIVQRPDDSGNLVVEKRDGKGRLDNDPFSIHADDARLAQPAKKCAVLVLAGKCKGSSGVVKTVIKNDVIMEIDGKQETLKLANCAWINVIEGN